ncbi:MAG: tRNA glutamyl-Q(34) synthetase GluQRS [Planctomycetes bacterium]|nr:tRNA glutamyl-Q(34) synthetase GluQRS [Planctomycetota bacterium]
MTPSAAPINHTGRGPVGRLAPSPTGPLHLGHAYAFLHAFWWTRSREGTVLLRFDDLDASRCRPEFRDLALRDLEWLGIEWSGTPLLQSSRLEAYAEALERLRHSPRAFGCRCTRRDLEAVAAPHAGEELLYPGTCRALGLDGPALRLRVPSEPVRLAEVCASEREVNLALEGGDFLVRTRSGQPSYQLVTALDDDHQGVTEVARGRDLLVSMGRQDLIRAELGLRPLSSAHLPLVVDASGRRLAKRAQDLSLEGLRAAGVDPVRILARAMDCDFQGGGMAEAHARALESYRLPLGSVRTAPTVDALRSRA